MLRTLALVATTVAAVAGLENDRDEACLMPVRTSDALDIDNIDVERNFIIYSKTFVAPGVARALPILHEAQKVGLIRTPITRVCYLPNIIVTR